MITDSWMYVVFVFRKLRLRPRFPFPSSRGRAFSRVVVDVGTSLCELALIEVGRSL